MTDHFLCRSVKEFVGQFQRVLRFARPVHRKSALAKTEEKHDEQPPEFRTTIQSVQGLASGLWPALHQVQNTVATPASEWLNSPVIQSSCDIQCVADRVKKL